MLLVLKLIKESLLFALNSLRSNLVRTLLSLLGVTVGIFCIVSVPAFMESIELGMKKSFEMIGDDVVFIQKWPMGPEEGEEEYAWWNYLSRRQPSLKDMDMLEERMDLAEAMAFQVGANEVAEFRNNNLNNAVLLGVTHDYENVINLNIEEGRYFSPLESEGGRNVGIVGYDVAQALFGNDSPIGQTIKMGGLKVDIIGMFEKEGASLLQNGFDKAVVVPVQFSTRLIDLELMDTSIMIKAKEGISNNELKNEVIGTFRPIRRLKPGQSNDFSIIEATMITQIIDSIFGVAQLVGIGIGLCALLVGGFGILNIMYVSVKERTNIIGIQKGLGAKNYFILLQFLFESVFLCIIGGIAGLILIYILFFIVNTFIDFETVLSLGKVIQGLIISAILGLLAGIIPAFSASRLNPVEAIRSK